VLLTPQQREHVDVFSKTCERNLAHLNIRFFRIYPYQKNITNPYGKGKGRPDRWVAQLKKVLLY